jgi:hypothetical protein
MIKSKIELSFIFLFSILSFTTALAANDTDHAISVYREKKSKIEAQIEKLDDFDKKVEQGRTQLEKLLEQALGNQKFKDKSKIKNTYVTFAKDPDEYSDAYSIDKITFSVRDIGEIVVTDDRLFNLSHGYQAWPYGPNVDGTKDSIPSENNFLELPDAIFCRVAEIPQPKNAKYDQVWASVGFFSQDPGPYSKVDPFG